MSGWMARNLLEMTVSSEIENDVVSSIYVRLVLKHVTVCQTLNVHFRLM